MIRLKISKTKNSRFLLGNRAGRCYNQPVSQNTFSVAPNKIVRFVNLEHPKTFKRHSFRRTSATLRHRNSCTSAQKTERMKIYNYRKLCLCNKNKIANRILHNEALSVASCSSSLPVYQSDIWKNIWELIKAKEIIH